MAVAQDEQPTGHKHRQPNGAARRELLHIDIPAIGSTVTSRLLDLIGGGGDEADRGVDGDLQPTGERQVSIVDRHHGWPACGELFPQKSSSGTYVMHGGRGRLDVQNIHLQRITGPGPLDCDRSRRWSHDRWLLIGSPDPHIGIPGLNQELLS
jgi:hypothetical protein